MNCKLAFLSLMLVTNSIFAANDVENTKTLNTVSQNSVINTTHVGTAKDWDLTDTEWGQYLSFMQGFSGHYYKQLSPPEVLGINASTAEELRHYSEISAKLEHDKLERELRFNAAFHDAATRLYVTEPIVKPFDYAPFTPIPKN
jgi:integrating conjugative element protein (TIGR03759 family)